MLRKALMEGAIVTEKRKKKNILVKLMFQGIITEN